jgi:hypothetical protein
MATHVEIALVAGYKTGIGEVQLLKNLHLCAVFLRTKALTQMSCCCASRGWPDISALPAATPLFFWAFMVASHLFMLYFFQVLGVFTPSEQVHKA